MSIKEELDNDARRWARLQRRAVRTRSDSVQLRCEVEASDIRRRWVDHYGRDLWVAALDRVRREGVS